MSDPNMQAMGLSGLGLNASDPTHRVSAITMPLVRLMRDGGLSWNDKETVAGVIRDVLSQAESMRKDIALAGQQLQPQQNQGDEIMKKLMR